MPVQRGTDQLAPPLEVQRARLRVEALRVLARQGKQAERLALAQRDVRERTQAGACLAEQSRSVDPRMAAAMRVGQARGELARGIVQRLEFRQVGMPAAIPDTHRDPGTSE